MSFATSSFLIVSPAQSTEIIHSNLASNTVTILSITGNPQESLPVLSTHLRTDTSSEFTANPPANSTLLDSHTDLVRNASASTTLIPASLTAQVTAQDHLASLKESALSGDPIAQYQLAQRLEIGDGIQQSDDESKYWYSKAADQGHARAQYCLGMMFSQGRQIKNNFEQSAYWIGKAADQNYLPAQCYLGVLYASGRGVDQDDDMAVSCYRKAAEQGYPMAQFKLGLAYANGRGVPQDDVESARWYLQSALQGLAEAQSVLGVRFSTGRGVELDEQQAAHWYKEAAEQGHTNSRIYLQKCYRFGKGVDIDLKLATYWSLKAGFIDFGDTIQMVDEIESIELMAPVLKEFPEFHNVRKLLFSNTFLLSKQMKYFENFMGNNPCFTSLNFLHVCFDSSAVLVDRFLKTNTTVTELLFDEEFLDKNISEQIKNSLIHNNFIAHLRQNFQAQLTSPTSEYPLDLVSMLIERLIVIYVKLGHSLEKTQKAIDEFLLITSVKQ